MFALNVYLIELQWRLMYVLISFFITFFTVFYFIDIFLFLEIYPFVKPVGKILIATYITELFHSVLDVCFFATYIFIFPLVFFHFFHFFAGSLHSYQLYFLKVVFTCIFFTCIFTFLVSYNLILPQLFDFFTQWESEGKNTIFQLTLNARIQFYLKWVNTVYSMFSCSLLFFVTLLFFTFSLFRLNVLFFFFKHYRKLISFCLTCVSYFIIPPDFILQIFFLGSSFFLCDLIFFLLCFKIYQRKKFLIAQ